MSRRMMLMAASCPSKSAAAVTIRTRLRSENVSAMAQSLEGWALEMLDGTDATDCFSFNTTTVPDVGGCQDAGTYRVFDNTGAEVVAQVPAAMLKMPFSVIALQSIRSLPAPP